MVKRHIKLWVTMLALLPLLTACPATKTTVPGPPPVAEDFSIDVSTAAPNFVSDSNVSVSVSITAVGGFDSEVVLSINDPAEVTAVFEPASTKTTSILSLSGSTPGTYPMTITGTSGDKSHTKNLSLTISEEPPPPPPATFEVKGKVLDAFGQPLTGAPVAILGQDSSKGVLSTTAITSISDTNGEFSLVGVKKPYDIVLVQSNTGHATIYQGLTTETPTLTSFVDMYAFYGFSIDGKNAKFTGKTNALPAPQGDHSHKGAFGSPETSRNFSIHKDGNLGGSSTLSDGVNVSWFGPTTTTGTAHVLQWKKDSNNLPDVYTGYGKRSIVLADSSTTNNQDIAMNSLGSENAGGTVNVPTGYSITNRFMSVILDEHSDIQVANEGLKKVLLLPIKESLASQASSPTLAADFNFRTPQINDAKIGIGVSARDTAISSSLSRYVYLAKTGLDLTDTNISLTLPEAPTLALPANNASNVDYTTEFSWVPSGFTESVNVVFISETKKVLTLTGGGPISFGNSIAIITKDTKMKLPDLSTLGITLVPPTPGESHDFRWNVTSIGPFGTVDSAATKDFGEAYYNESASRDVFYGDSQSFEFKVVAP